MGRWCEWRRTWVDVEVTLGTIEEKRKELLGARFFLSFFLCMAKFGSLGVLLNRSRDYCPFLSIDLLLTLGDE